MESAGERMVNYEFLDEKNPNAVRFLAHGSSLEETFTFATQALFEIITKPENISPKVVKTIEIRAETPQALLYDWLEEVMRLVRNNSFLAHDIRIRIVKHGDEFVLKGRLRGDVTSDRQLTSLKAIAHEDTHLEERGDKYTIQVSAKTY